MVVQDPSSAATTIENLLPRGLEPDKVCDQYFQACWDKDNERWLACLHVKRRATATSQKPGPFAVCNWELGRARVEKYKVQYKYTGSSADGGLQDAEPRIVLEYQPVYGPVPGYEEGSPLGGPIYMTLQKQGGREGEWRVVEGGF